MTDKEISSTWTTDEDSKRNEDDIIKTVKAMRQTSSSRTKQNDDDNMCFRGLEHMQCKEILQQRKVNKESVIDTVLDEQERQWDANVHDDTKIAAASISVSKSAVQNAVTAGRSDAAHSHRMNGNGISILSTPRRNCNSLSPCLEKSLDGSNSAFDVKKSSLSRNAMHTKGTHSHGSILRRESSFN